MYDFFRKTLPEKVQNYLSETNGDCRKFAIFDASGDVLVLTALMSDGKHAGRGRFARKSQPSKN